MLMKLFAPYQIERMTNRAIRQEYSKLRSTANKRLQRLEAAGLGDRGKFRFPVIKGKTDAEIAAQLADVSRFLKDPRTTVTGEKKFVEGELKMLREKGYDFVDRSNFYDFIKFMDEKRAEVGGKLFDSGDAADVFNEGQRLNIPVEVLKKNYDFFAENLSAMEKTKPIKTSRNIRFSDIKRKMKRWL